MANEIEVMIKSKADTSGFDKAKHETDRYGDSVDSLTEKSDNSERSLIGTADIIGGIGGIMAGPGEQGMQSYITSWADLGGGLAGVLPLLKAMSIEALKNAAAQIRAGAATVASWLAAKAAAVASAAQMAAAWVISLGPIAIVVAALVGLGLVFIALWRKSETFRDIVKGVFDKVRGAVDPVVDVVKRLVGWFGNLVNFVGKIGGALKAIGGFFKGLLAPIGDAINAVKRFLGVSGLLVPMGAEVVAIVRGATSGGSGGGSGTGSKKGAGFARGGIVGGGMTQVAERGGEWLDLPAGAHIRSNADTRSMGYGGGGGPVVITFADDGSAAGRFILEMARKAVRSAGGGNVQLAFGS